jgi:HEAT repeat protein
MQREDIDKMAASGDIDGLVGALGDRDPEIRQKAAAQLGFMGDRRAVEPLARLRDSDSTATVRRAAGIAHQRLSECIAATDKECESLCPPET